MLRRKYQLFRHLRGKGYTYPERSYHYTKLGAWLASRFKHANEISSSIYYIPKYSIDEFLDSDSGRYGQWLGIHLETWGDSKQELLDNAVLYIMDQDGGEVNNLPAIESAYYAEVEHIIAERVARN